MKKILFIGPGYSNYDKRIIEELRKNFDVKYFCFAYMDYFHPRLLSILQKFRLFGIITAVNNFYINKQIELTKGVYDTVFVIKGDYFTEEHLKKLISYYSNSRLVLYLWDDIARIKNATLLRKYFKIIYSFDSEDCRKYGFILRPLFYTDKISPTIKDIDISFVGNNHSNRMGWLSNLESFCRDNGLSYSFRLLTSKSFIISKVIKCGFNFYKERKAILSFHNMKYKDYIQLTNRSKAVVDFPFPSQSGLTIRTIESLSLGTKVITTNPYISDYPDIPDYMYFVIDKYPIDSKKLRDFLGTPHPDYRISKRYNVESFVNEIINN